MQSGNNIQIQLIPESLCKNFRELGYKKQVI